MDGCPTCSHTMALLTFHEPVGLQYWHCERCGTVVTKATLAIPPDAVRDVCVPKLVERCRELYAGHAGCLNPDPYFVSAWHRTGIAESINRPEDRK